MKRINTIVCASLVCASLAVADGTKSLVGIEGGIGEMGVTSDAGYDKTKFFMHGGFKIGAQSENYRIFVGGRYYDTQSFEYLTTIGVEFQYLFNYASWGNLFVGGNVGLLDAEFKDVGNNTRTFSDMYYGADAGLNFHASDLIDLELGVRMIDVNGDNTIGGVTYSFDPMVTAYGSIIIKYDLD